MFFSFFKSFFGVIWSFIVGFKWILIPLGIFIVIFTINLFYFKFRYFRGCKREVVGHVNIVPKPNLFVKLFILLPKQFWKNYYNRPKGAFNEHGIIVFCGAQGQGKTIAETQYLNDMNIKYPSLKIYTNYGYLKEDMSITDWRALVDYNNGVNGVICALDELQNWFSSSMSKNFPPRMMATVTQNRKNRRVIIASAHFFNNLAKPIRIHATEIRDCRTFLGCFTVVKRTRPLFDSSGEVFKRRLLGYYCFVHDEDLYNSYDTYKIISNLSEAGFKDDNFAIIQGDSSNSAPRSKKRSRSAFVEHSVNQNIDNVMGGF